MKNVFFLLVLIWVSAPAMADDEVMARPSTEEEMGWYNQSAAPTASTVNAPEIDFSQELRNCLVKQVGDYIEKKRLNHDAITEIEVAKEELRAFGDECVVYSHRLSADQVKQARRQAAHDIVYKYDSI